MFFDVTKDFLFLFFQDHGRIDLEVLPNVDIQDGSVSQYQISARKRLHDNFQEAQTGLFVDHFIYIFLCLIYICIFISNLISFYLKAKTQKHHELWI